MESSPSWAAPRGTGDLTCEWTSASADWTSTATSRSVGEGSNMAGTTARASCTSDASTSAPVDTMRLPKPGSTCASITTTTTTSSSSSRRSSPCLQSGTETEALPFVREVPKHGSNNEVASTQLEGSTTLSALAGTAVAPMEGSAMFSPHRLRGDEEEGLGCPAEAAGESRYREARNLPTGNSKEEAQVEVEAELLLGGPDSAGYRKRWLCGRAIAVLRLAWSTVRFAVTFLAAALAIFITFWALFPVCTSCKRTSSRGQRASPDENERGWSTLYINQLQVIGTHNSYHQRTFLPALGDYWKYHYPSLTAQLDAGVRHLELDIHYDWKTGRWFVYHLAVLDAVTSCSCLSVCLDEIKEWSDAHPAHHILFIEIELKLYGDFLQICRGKTPDTDHTAFLALQETVADVFPPDRILTPRQVRGDYETLTEAIKFTATTTEASPPPSVESGGDLGNVPGSSISISNSGGSSSGTSSFPNGSDAQGVVSTQEGVVHGLGQGTDKAGGWPLVDATRGMVLFIIDYQSLNIVCRPAARKALPDDETFFFERTPLRELETSARAAFGEVNPYRWTTINQMVQSGLIVRNPMKALYWGEGEGPGDRPGYSDDDGSGAVNHSYLVNTPAQLLVADDLAPVEGAISDVRRRRQGAQGDDLPPPPLQCRSRCSTIVPSEDCILEGFC